MGCGQGQLAEDLINHFDMCKKKTHLELYLVGTDINEGAVSEARQRILPCRHSQTVDNNATNTTTSPYATPKPTTSVAFEIADVTSTIYVEQCQALLRRVTTTTATPYDNHHGDDYDSKSDNEEGSTSTFDLVIMQLLISIVGTVEHRHRTLQNASKLLRDGGKIYLSASGISDQINPKYAQLYEQDKPLTGEEYTYYSRGKTTTTTATTSTRAGRILYTTHHFSVSELEELLNDTGFFDVRIQQRLEHSSRRPDEAAYFLYAVATKAAHAST
jgi:SAM-dependent methyltransferase